MPHNNMMIGDLMTMLTAKDVKEMQEAFSRAFPELHNYHRGITLQEANADLTLRLKYLERSNAGLRFDNLSHSQANAELERWNGNLRNDRTRLMTENQKLVEAGRQAAATAATESRIATNARNEEIQRLRRQVDDLNKQVSNLRIKLDEAEGKAAKPAVKPAAKLAPGQYVGTMVAFDPAGATMHFGGSHNHRWQW
jgi:hypothetical protein